MAKPADDEGWIALRHEVNDAFSPGSPIKIRNDLAGREPEIVRLCDIVLRRGEHAIIFGDRGVGKTSLARTFHAALGTSTRRIQEIHVNCVEEDTYDSLWRKVFRRMTTTVDGSIVTVDSQYSRPITQDDVHIELGQFSLNDLPIIIIDEFDRLRDDRAKTLMTDTIKALSDDGIHCKLIIVGVAENASQLLSKHLSISRNLKQIKIPRLSVDERRQIILPRLKRCGISIEDDALFYVAFLSRGLPYYCHLIGQYAAISAIEGKRINITLQDVLDGLAAALLEVDQTLTEDYLKAIVSQRPDETLYEPVIIACALADTDELDRFQQSSVTNPLSYIAPRKPPYTPTTFAFHMNDFCEERRGYILEKNGEARNYRYKFKDPMMQPYVILRALHSKRLTVDILEKFIPSRQRSLPI